MMETRPGVSDAEREVLKVLWDLGPGTVREVAEHLAEIGREWSRSTVITLLQRLERKGYVTSDQTSPAFVFHPALTRESFAQLRIAELADDLYVGEPGPLVLAFAEQHRFTDEELRRLRELIGELEAKRRKGKGSR